MLDKEKRVMRAGLTVMACMLALDLAGPLSRLLSVPEVAALVVYLETGRVVKMQLSPPEETMVPETLPPQTVPEEKPAQFREEDAELIQVRYHWDCQLDTQAMLMSELSWDLTEQGPTVLILHSHATESYTQTMEESYEASSAYRTLDTEHNMIRVGEALKAALEARGIGVIHDTSLHDYPSYTDAYIQSREAVRAYLEQYPGICLVLDLHRDAAELSGGGQLATQATVDGESAAQLMLVVGTDAGGRTHPDWEENMALAVKLHTQLEKRYPGLCRPISLRTERFNQDLCPGTLLVEVGAAGDTLEEALAAVEALAEGIGDLALGSATAGTTS